MSVDELPFALVDVDSAADRLIAGLMEQPWGQVSASVYETGRLVTLAPWLVGHAERVNHLIATQRPDGGWGAPGGYALIPTLSATEALLGQASADAKATQSVSRGLDVLFRWLSTDLLLPDMPAIELIAPSLVTLINQRLDRLNDESASGLALWMGNGRLPMPKGMSNAKVSMIQAHLKSGAVVQDKLLHALEAAGDAACGASGVTVGAAGNVGGSPAATAAWLRGRGQTEAGVRARGYLERAAERHAGPVPCALPITEFERGWVLSWLVRAGVPVAVPPRLLEELSAAIRADGASGGAGLPSDADSTSVALYALALLGVEREPDSLWHYELDTHFCTWQGEQGDSVTTNAHVLDTLGHYAHGRTGLDSRYARATRKVSAWLVEQQHLDGNWQDRWHASPYYATTCCVLALSCYGTNPAPVERAVRWIIDSQNADGSWGRWGGTAEETAYAMQAVLLADADLDGRGQAAARGYAYLLDAPALESGPALWHDKDLYKPEAIVRAAILGAVHMAQRDPSLVSLSKKIRQ
ncbi:prenyltransferase/squalene oxidase repeat-containing protein [Nonomuraea sp. NPDC050536]|uniref:prenyltransferase/squalene oxidase repeat-containing protein n=1 Tax=Nonomuraea sp. NPDC050536 TaxID=3364366 RepID=UPI0037CC1C13